MFKLSLVEVDNHDITARKHVSGSHDVDPSPGFIEAEIPLGQASGQDPTRILRYALHGRTDLRSLEVNVIYLILVTLSKDVKISGLIPRRRAAGSAGNRYCN
jgi:hypothetical protein